MPPRYYVALMSRSHVFLLERRLKNEGIPCELTYMPREVMIDLCNMGIRLEEYILPQALAVIRRSGLPGCKVYQEIVSPEGYAYYQVPL